jgi:PAS domain S-box-containing protein
MTDTLLALHESEELHRITLQNMSDAVFITNDDGAFTYICPNVDVIFGYGRDEVNLMGRISRLLGRDLVKAGQLATAGELRNIEHEIEAKGGVRRVLLVHVKHVAIRLGTHLYTCRDITERKEFESALRSNQQRLTLALEAAGAGTWDWDVPTGEMTWSPEAHRLFGDVSSSGLPSFESFLERVHPLDRDRVERTITDAMARSASYEAEFRVVGFDQVERWVLGKGRAVSNGKPLRMLGVFVDLTERHQAEQELRELGGRLIHAHEQERIRLSQELHDDVGQRIALLSAELAILRQQLAAAPPLPLQQVDRLSEQVDEIGSELHRFSYALHPMRLHQLGLAAAVRTLCDDIAATRRISIHLTLPPATVSVNPDVALCLYRIAQESLHNVVKHSNAANATVSLTVDDAGVVLRVVDNGIGFDPSGPRRANALGLVSMRERARLARGTLAVSSKRGEGTQVQVRVPTMPLRA